MFKRCYRDGVWRIVAGEHDLSSVDGNEQTRSVKKVTIHPDYNYSNSDSDIAILEVPLKTTNDT